MKLRIGGRPTANIFDYIRKPLPGKQMQFPFFHPQRHFYFSARYALAEGIQVLGLKPGDKVLLPAYNCGIEIEPFHHYGVKTEYYQVGRNLLTDLNDLRTRLNENIRAVFTTHYLGFPQPIEEILELCKERGVFLIEDCAHALLSSHNGVSLGAIGDIAVFSILKTLPVPNGGILVVNNDSIHLEQKQRRPSRFSAACHVSELLMQKTSPVKESVALIEMVTYRLFSWLMNVAKRILAVSRKLTNLGGLHLVRPDSYDFKSELLEWGISHASENIIANTDLNHVIELRRSNFSQYLTRFKAVKPAGVTLLHTELTAGICPLFFPIIFDEEGTREIVYQELKKRGITTHPWWDRFHPRVPWIEYPDAVYLKQRLFGLPVHQDLTPFHIDRTFEEFMEVLSALTNQKH